MGGNSSWRPQETSIGAWEGCPEGCSSARGLFAGLWLLIGWWLLSVMELPESKCPRPMRSRQKLQGFLFPSLESPVEITSGTSGSTMVKALSYQRRVWAWSLARKPGPALVVVLMAQACPTLCDPLDCSLTGSSVHSIFQTRILEWVAVSFSRGSPWPRNQTHISWVSCTARRFFTTWATLAVGVLPTPHHFCH